jgi:DNA ligase 1
MGKEKDVPVSRAKATPKAKRIKDKDGNIASFFGATRVASPTGPKQKGDASLFSGSSSLAAPPVLAPSIRDGETADSGGLVERKMTDVEVTAIALPDGPEGKDTPTRSDRELVDGAESEVRPVRVRKRRILRVDDDDENSDDNAVDDGHTTGDIATGVLDDVEKGKDIEVAKDVEMVEASAVEAFVSRERPAAHNAEQSPQLPVVESEREDHAKESTKEAISSCVSKTVRKPCDNEAKSSGDNDVAALTTSFRGDSNSGSGMDDAVGANGSSGESDNDEADAFTDDGVMLDGQEVFDNDSGGKPPANTSAGKERGHVAASLSSRKRAQVTESLNFSEKPTWDVGKPVPYAYLAETFSKVEAITGRLEIQAILTDLFRKIINTTPDDLVPAIYLCVNKLAPAHEGIEMGVGEAILLAALSKTTGSTIAALRAKQKEVGDLGDVAFISRTTQTTMFPPPPLTIRKVFSEMRAIAQGTGKAVVDMKKSKILKLLVASVTKNEAKYLARALQGKLRIHLADKTVVVAVASAFTLIKLNVGTGALLSVDGKKKAKLSAKEEELQESLKDAANRLSTVYNQLPVWEKIVPSLLKHKEVSDAIVEECKFTPGVPVSPMLAKPTTAISDVLDRFAESSFTCEFKYDGERAQVHRLENGTVKIYSRNAEDLTPKYPDLVRQLPKALKDKFKEASFVLDSESVAYDVVKKQILPFQELQGRKRKDVDESSVTVQVCVFSFDLLYFNGESLLTESLSKRRQVMMESFDEVEGVFMFAKGHDSREPEEIMDLLNESIKAGCEGLMVKALDGPNGTYEPANRSQNWLKVKKDYLDGLGDTLDLVPIAGYLGRGKRTGVYGGFLLACYDAESEQYQTVCKIGTGFSDVNLETFSKYFQEEGKDRIVDGPKSYYRLGGSKSLDPDHWFEPCQVWEVLCADLSLSPSHTAAIGLVDDNKGIALRFPRFVRVRDDKSPEDATSAEQIAELYSRQSSVANNKEPNGKPRR